MCVETECVGVFPGCRHHHRIIVAQGTHNPRLTGIMLQNLFNAYATVAFFQFVIFAIFEMRYLLSVWRARRASVDPWTAQRELSMLYARFYGVLLGGMLLMFQLVKCVGVCCARTCLLNHISSRHVAQQMPLLQVHPPAALPNV